MPRKTLTDNSVEALKPRDIRYAHPDPELSGHYIRVTPNGAKSFFVKALAPDGKPVGITIGKVGLYTIDQARDRAREIIKRVRGGLTAIEAPPDKPATWMEAAELWMERRVIAEGFKQGPEFIRTIRRYTYPHWTCAHCRSKLKPKLKPKLTYRAQLALDQLFEALADDGEIQPANGHIPPNTRAVHKDMWRRRFVSVHPAENTPRSKGSAFERAYITLMRHKIIGAFEKMIWIAPPDIATVQRSSACDCPSMNDIKRTRVNALMDFVTDHHGTPVADKVYKAVRLVMVHHAGRTDDYVVPLVRGMRPKPAPSRDRVLKDDELRAVWNFCEMVAQGKMSLPGMSPESARGFVGILRLCLLTVQRRSIVASMKWEDLSPDLREWTIPWKPRDKDNARFLILPPEVVNIINAQPRVAGNPYVFVGAKGRGPWRNWCVAAKALKKSFPDFPRLTNHDLRRTGRTRMTAAGVINEHAERVMAHKVPGIAGIYNRAEYIDEKTDALARLAWLIDSKVHPRENVLPFVARSETTKTRELVTGPPPDELERTRRALAEAKAENAKLKAQMARTTAGKRYAVVPSVAKGRKQG